MIPSRLPGMDGVHEEQVDEEMSFINTLWMRVWWQAVRDYVYYKDAHKEPHTKDAKTEKGRKKRCNLASDAAMWLFEEGCGCTTSTCKEARLSFPEFCRRFNMDPSKVRSWVLRLTKDDLNTLGRNLL